MRKTFFDKLSKSLHTHDCAIPVSHAAILGTPFLLRWDMHVLGVFPLRTMTAVVLPAQTFNTLFSFDGANGLQPVGVRLVQGPDGDLYGTTSFGGANGVGTVFKITPTGALTTLYNFCKQQVCFEGDTPSAGLTLASDGSFYGTGVGGSQGGYGVVFRFSPKGRFTTIFSMNGTDGALPSGLVLGADGDFYGTAAFGGPFLGGGVIFKITAGGAFTELYRFEQDGISGFRPQDPLIQGTDGNFYGTTSAGGANGVGTIFKITPSGKLSTQHSFNTTDGANPYAGLVQGRDGNFYGTTSAGGASGLGTVFRITPSGKLTILHSFNTADGVKPYAGLVQGSDGNFYGTTLFGGASNGGPIFEVTPSGEFTTLESLDNEARFTQPDGGLFQASNGVFYGTTSTGGNSACEGGCGTIYSVDLGLGPLVSFVPASGMEGKIVTILGNNLTGATSVTFNGAAAIFKVISASEIKATVPAGATTGPVAMTTPHATLTSDLNFIVP